MKIPRHRTCLFTVAAIIFWGLPIIGPAAAPDPNSPSLRTLENDRQKLLIDTRKLGQKILEEIRLSAIRQRNDVLKGINELESTFSRSRFEQLLIQAQWVHLAAGGKPEIIDGYYGIASRIISLAEPSHVETIRESYNVRAKNGAADRHQAIAAYRQGLWELVSIACLRHLVMEDTLDGLNGFRTYIAPLQRIQAAEQFKTQAEAITLQAEQQVTQDIAAGIPLVGEAIDLVGIATGKAALTGEELSATQRAIDAVLLLAPDVLEKAFTGKPAFLRDMENLSAKVDSLDPDLLKRLSAKVKKSPKQLKNMSRKIKTASAASQEAVIAGYTTSRKKIRKLQAAREARELDQQILNRLNKIGSTKELDRAVDVWNQAGKQGKEKIKTFGDNIPSGSLKNSSDPGLLDAYQAVRKDKRALNEIQKEAYQALREQMQELENKLFSHVDLNGNFVMGEVDTDAITNLKKGFSRPIDPDRLAAAKAKALKDRTPGEILLLKKEAAGKQIISQVKRHGQKNGITDSQYLDTVIDFNNLDITVFNATNKPPAPGKIGFDRDITYQIDIPGKKMMKKNPNTGRMEVIDIPPAKVDIPAELVEEQYHRSLYKKLNPDRPMPSREKIMAFGRDMDHQVTDAMHKDAYRLDLERITDFFKDPSKIVTESTRLEGFADTVSYKSKHWFELAQKTKDQGQAMAEVAEGMRQAAKQKENYMEVLFAYYGSGAAKRMDSRLKKGLHIFEMVRQGKLSVPKAEAALHSISMTKEAVADGFGQYFESMVKLSSKTNRAVQEKIAKKMAQEAAQ
ncbi:MAG: pre-toxin TG domain-containing protein [Desulfobacterales bacterium]|nr:pre-toxin TG domain-containing protein [Desulfobacterales bacterium]